MADVPSVPRISEGVESTWLTATASDDSSTSPRGSLKQSQPYGQQEPDAFDVDDWFMQASENVLTSVPQQLNLEDVEGVMGRMLHPTSGVEIKDRKYMLKVYKLCFVGEMAVEWICKYFNCDKKEAVQVGQKMYDKGYIVHVVDSGKGFHDEFLFYEFTEKGLQCYKESEGFKQHLISRNERLAKPLEEVLIAFMDSRKGVDVRDRKYHMKWYKRCFVGSDAVLWLQKFYLLHYFENDYAVKKGQELIDKGFVLHTVDVEKPFLPSYLFYVFTPLARQTEARYMKKLTTAIHANSPKELAWQMQNPITGLFCRDHKRRMKTYKNCFTGEDLIDWVLKYMRVRSRPDALKVANKLVAEDFIYNVKKKENVLVDSPKELYRFRIKKKSFNGVSQGTLMQDEGDYVSVEDFQFKQVLGVGGFGTVYLAKKKDNERHYAIKSIRKARFRSQKDIDSLLLESEVLRNDHPYLLHLYWAFTNKDYIYLVLDYIGGGDLFHHLQQHRSGFARKTVQFFIAQVLLGLEHLHACGIIYRDMKLENILLDVDGNICLADFGLSKILDGADDRAMTMCGTPGYVAPEVLLGKGYGTNVDIWSMGVLMYELSTGRNPFLGSDRHQTLLNIMKVTPYYPDEYFSKRARSLLQLLLLRDPKERPQRAEELKSHPYFKDIEWTKLLLKQVPSPFQILVEKDDDVRHFDEEFTKLKIRLEDNSPIHEIEFTDDRTSMAQIDVRWSQFRLVAPDAAFTDTNKGKERADDDDTYADCTDSSDLSTYNC